MTECSYNSGRIMPIFFNENELLENIKLMDFFICQITSGFVVLKIDGEVFYVSSSSLLCLHREKEIELIASYDLQAKSVSFDSKFMNVNLNWDLVKSENYPKLCEDLNFSRFDLFFKKNIIYKGVLPLGLHLHEKIDDIFNKINIQISDQPDSKWSCRARSYVFSLFGFAENHCNEFMKGHKQSDMLERKVLDYIHLNLCLPIRIGELCDLFGTNHTTLSKKFKAYTKFSIGEYIIEKRLLLAKHSLAFTELSIDEIAKNNGFNESSYFTRLFKARIGITPLKYRAEEREKREDGII